MFTEAPGFATGFLGGERAAQGLQANAQEMQLRSLMMQHQALANQLLSNQERAYESPDIQQLFGPTQQPPSGPMPTTEPLPEGSPASQLFGEAARYQKLAQHFASFGDIPDAMKYNIMANQLMGQSVNVAAKLEGLNSAKLKNAQEEAAAVAQLAQSTTDPMQFKEGVQRLAEQGVLDPITYQHLMGAQYNPAVQQQLVAAGTTRAEQAV